MSSGRNTEQTSYTPPCHLVSATHNKTEAGKEGGGQGFHALTCPETSGKPGTTANGGSVRCCRGSKNTLPVLKSMVCGVFTPRRKLTHFSITSPTASRSFPRVWNTWKRRIETRYKFLCHRDGCLRDRGVAALSLPPMSAVEGVQRYNSLEGKSDQPCHFSPAFDWQRKSVFVPGLFISTHENIHFKFCSRINVLELKILYSCSEFGKSIRTFFF